jgi:hypothetical protein
MLCARHGFVHVSVKKIIRDSAAECMSGMAKGKIGGREEGG